MESEINSHLTSTTSTCCFFSLGFYTGLRFCSSFNTCSLPLGFSCFASWFSVRASGRVRLQSRNLIRRRLTHPLSPLCHPIALPCRKLMLVPCCYILMITCTHNPSGSINENTLNTRLSGHYTYLHHEEKM